MLFAGLGFLALAGVKAQPVAFERHPLEDISRVAVEHALTLLDDSIYSEVSATSQPMDERLRLKRCEQPLEASINSSIVQAGRTSVHVRCPGPAPWALYVPVQIHATTPVVMVQGPLPRGTVLRETHLAVQDVPVDQLPPHYLRKVEDVVGQELVRNVNTPTYATAHMMKVRNLVEKGQEVVIMAKNNNLEVRMAGVAQEGGQAGDFISVKNSTSGVTVQGKIAGSGTIEVSF